MHSIAFYWYAIHLLIDGKNSNVDKPTEGHNIV